MRQISDLEKEIIDFAKKKSQIVLASRGIDPEEGTPAYWFHVGGKYDFELGKDITSLSLRLHRKYRKNIEIFQWPANEEASFLGEKIYTRET